MSIQDRLNAIQEIEPDATDIEALNRIAKANDTSEGISLEEMDAIREAQEYSGKVSLRLPKSLHAELVGQAKQEGISLNQYILYKLAR